MNLSRFLIATQLVLLLGLFMNTRTMLFTYLYVALLFMPSIMLGLYTKNEKITLVSIIVLFVSERLINSFSHPSYGFSWGSDQWNDYHVLEALSNAEKFELGRIGCTERAPSYSYYVFLHLFAHTLNQVSNLPLFFIANFVIPVVNSVLVSIALYYMLRYLLKFRNIQNSTIAIATILFTTTYYYVHFQSQFIRETFAFPLALLLIAHAMEYVKQPNFESFILQFILMVTVVMSHHFSSYMLIAILLIFAIIYDKRLMKLALLSIVTLFSWVTFVTLDIFAQHATATLHDLAIIFVEPVGVSPVMAKAYSFERSLALVYYLLLGFFGIIGALQLLKAKRIKKEILPLSLSILFPIATLLRIFPPSRWGYNMALRATIWSAIGLSYVAAIGMKPLLKRRKHFLVLIVLILALGYFAQYPQFIKDANNPPPFTYADYRSAVWLKQYADYGSNFLFDRNNIDKCYAIEPYGNLRLYHYHDKNFDELELYKGYIPLFENSFFSSYLSNSLINVVHDNENISIGYQER